MKLYCIRTYTDSDEQILKAHGAYFFKNEKAFVFSEYTPNREFFDKWEYEEKEDNEKVSLTILSKRLGLNPRSVQEFLIHQNMLQRIDKSCQLTDRAKEHGAEYVTHFIHGENATFPVYGEEWANYLNKYRDKIEAISSSRKKDSKKESRKERESKNNEKISITRYPDAIYTKFQKVGVPDNAVFLDTETTGLGEYDEVIDLGIIDTEGNVLYNGLFKPFRPNSPGAQAVNHLTEDMLKNAPDFNDELFKIQKVLNNRIIVGHNIKFDMRLLKQTIEIHNGDSSFLKNCRTIDTMDIAKCFMKVKKYKLETLCQILGKTDNEVHRALDDTQWTLWLCETFENRPFEAL